MLNDEHGVSRVDQPLQNIDQPVHIRHMKPRRGLVENIDRSAGCAAGELRCKLYALRLAAGKRCRALAELYIAKADVHERLHLLADLRKVFKERERLLGGHVENL